MKIFKIIYAAKYRQMGARYHGRHCRILKVATGKPKNVLVKLAGGELAIIPFGNLRLETDANQTLVRAPQVTAKAAPSNKGVQFKLEYFKHTAKGFTFTGKRWTCKCGRIWELLLSRRYPERFNWAPTCRCKTTAPVQQKLF